MGITAQLLQNHDKAWREMTEHAFLQKVADGSISDEDFARWLEQDYHFVAGLISFVVGLNSRLPDSHPLAGACGLAVDALQAELDLFEREASRFGALISSANLSPTCFNYLNYLFHVRTEQPLPVAILVYWTLEQAYFDSWSYVASVGRASPRLSGLIANWTNPAFCDYVELLRSQADKMLLPEQHAAAEAAFLRTLQFEFLFWDLGQKLDHWPLEGREH